MAAVSTMGSCTKGTEHADCSIWRHNHSLLSWDPDRSFIQVQNNVCRKRYILFFGAKADILFLWQFKTINNVPHCQLCPHETSLLVALFNKFVPRRYAKGFSTLGFNKTPKVFVCMQMTSLGGDLNQCVVWLPTKAISFPESPHHTHTHTQSLCLQQQKSTHCMQMY